MNNHFNSSLQPQSHHNVAVNQQQQQQLLQHATTLTTTLGYLQQTQMQLPHTQQQLDLQHLNQQQTLYEPLKLQAATSVSNGLDKTSYYATHQAGSAAPTQLSTATNVGRLFNRTNNNAHPNTILITNNFAQQQQQQQQQKNQPTQLVGNFNNSNIRIISTAPNALQQPQHIYNISSSNNNNNIPKNATQQQIYATQHLTELLPCTYAAAVTQQQDFGATSTTLQPTYYVTTAAAPDSIASTAAKANNIANHPTSTSNTAKLLSLSDGSNPMDGSGNQHKLYHTTNSSTTAAATASNHPSQNNQGSTVVLDRINICINNHYSETGGGSNAICSPVAISATPTQQGSPIIPAIQHKPLIDSSRISIGSGVAGSGLLLIDSYTNSNSSEPILIDEPDSTTAIPNTPPTTPPENIALTTTTTIELQQSPSTTTTDSVAATTTTKTHKSRPKATADSPTLAEQANSDSFEEMPQSTVTTAAAGTTTPLTPPTPTTPATSKTSDLQLALTPSPPKSYSFALQEDVFIKRQDGRFYLGTIMDSALQKYLVRFDDTSELWCAPDEMRRLGGASSSNEKSGGGKASDTGPMCVACKRPQSGQIVEICERCGRGYHRNCTMETMVGSGVWYCKRCAKPMKMTELAAADCNKKPSVCRQLPYHSDNLSWDNKHRVNAEQIYCYCGKSGKFDHNMLQCCKCSNWFHTHCMQNFKSKILRGDGFFVFCCSVCNDGNEFLRRLQIDWIDVLHLTLYNLSAVKKHQHQKYHHLLKDIWPFILEKRHILPIRREWIELPETSLMECIKHTLKTHTERFICGREIKRDHFYYALRINGPPILPKIQIASNDVLCDDLVTEKLQLMLLKGAPENDIKIPDKCNFFANGKSSSKDDVYEFRIEDDDSTEDELPIKHIMEKVKKYKNKVETTKKPTPPSSEYSLDVDDDNANDALTTADTTTIATKSTAASTIIATKLSNHDDQTMIKTVKERNKKHSSTNGNSLAIIERSSCKRKAFRLSKSYKEIAAKRYDSNRCQNNSNSSNMCDLLLSSDENSSSSSRGTSSLDLIIPPPKNFLGSNNPFLMVTPKKNNNNNNNKDNNNGVNKKSVSFAAGAGIFVNGNIIKNSIFNTTALDFSTKLAHLKSAGIFPNLSNLTKAAGQPRTVRTIKRRLSAKDITIGPNQEVRRRRTRRLSSNIEVISTTTINTIPSNYFPIHAKDYHQHTTSTTTTTTTSAAAAASASSAIAAAATTATTTQKSLISSTSASTLNIDSLSGTAGAAATAASTKAQTTTATTTLHKQPPTHGRRLRQRPQKSNISPGNSRRSSFSGASTSSNQSTTINTTNTSNNIDSSDATIIMQDLKQSVNKYFGCENRIESGEQFSIRAKRHLANGQTQFLIEWGDIV